MAIPILTEIFEGLNLFLLTVWELQEVRFAAIFDDAASVVFTVIWASVSCFLALRRP